jgi:archaellum component FlaC
MATGYVRTDNSSVIDGLKQENAALLERLQQCDRAIQRIASHVGAVCGGVDVMDANGLGSHTSEEIIRKIEAVRQEAVPQLEPTKEMIEAGAQRLVSWEDNSVWPDSWSPLHVAAARNEAERVWRSMWLAAPTRED